MKLEEIYINYNCKQIKRNIEVTSTRHLITCYHNWLARTAASLFRHCYRAGERGHRGKASVAIKM